jgi:hypothetical protein
MRKTETKRRAQGTKEAEIRPRSAWLVAILGGLLAGSLGLGACGDGAPKQPTVDRLDDPAAAANVEMITEGPDEFELESSALLSRMGGSWYKTCPNSWFVSPDYFCAQCYTKSHTLPDVAYCYRPSTCKTWCGWNDNGRLRCGNC